MELTAERLPLFRDEPLLRPVYAHQKFLRHDAHFDKLKVHVATAGGKTLGGILFALRDTFSDPSAIVRTILTYPTNLLSRDQFEHSVVRALTDWVGAEQPRIGVINPVKRCFEQSSLPFADAVSLGAPTYVFALPPSMGGRDLYVTVMTGEGLQHLFSQENIVQMGRRKGTYLLAVLDVLNQRDHIIVCSPDLLGYVAQRCYSVTGNFYNSRWRDELEIKLANHKVVIDEYHFYDPYTYLNLRGTLEKLGAHQQLFLSATGVQDYFPDADVLDPAQWMPRWTSLAEGENVASYPIEVLLHSSEIGIADVSPPCDVIYFYHSAIAAHQVADDLRARGVEATEWTGIRKSAGRRTKLTVATSAAEVGLDLPFREVHTEFWGNAWEVPSLLQRIGRVGRSPAAGNSRAHIWITGREPVLLPQRIQGLNEISKAEFGRLLRETFGGNECLCPANYVSYYLWDERLTRELRRFWQMPPHDNSKLRFHFRPPNSQAIFNWDGWRFVYDWIPIANRYRLSKMQDVTDMPFWQEMGYSEWKVVEPLERRQYHQRYEGKKDKDHRRWFWDE